MSLEQLLNDGNADMKRVPSPIVRSANDLQTLLQGLCDQKSASSPDIVNVIKNVCVYLSLVFKVAMEVTNPFVQVSNIELKPLLESNKPVLKSADQAKGGKNKRSECVLSTSDRKHVSSIDRIAIVSLSLRCRKGRIQRERPVHSYRFNSIHLRGENHRNPCRSVKWRALKSR